MAVLHDLSNSWLRLQVCLGLRVEAWNNANLSAPHWRLYYNLDPGAWVNLAGARAALDPAHWMLIPPNTPFASGHQRPFRHLYLHFTAKPPYEKLEPAIFRLAASRETRSRLAALYAMSQPEAPSQAVAQALATSLVCQALAQMPQPALLQAKLDGRIASVMDLMEGDLSIAAGNSALAKKAGMSENAFVRLFSAQAGSSPQAYFTVKRIDRACDLLHHSSAGIQEIAEATGFCDRYHFSRVFKKIRGISPARFRAQGSFQKSIALRQPEEAHPLPEPRSAPQRRR